MELVDRITFEANLPEDGEWDAHGQPRVPSGRAIADVVCAGLTNIGFRCTAPVPHLFYGWAFDVTDTAGGAFWCLLQYAEPWLILTEYRAPLVKRLFRRFYAEEQAVVMAAIKRTIESDSRFSSVALWTKEGYESRQNRGARR